MFAGGLALAPEEFWQVLPGGVAVFAGDEDGVISLAVERFFQPGECFLVGCIQTLKLLQLALVPSNILFALKQVFAQKGGSWSVESAWAGWPCRARQKEGDKQYCQQSRREDGSAGVRFGK